MELSEKVRNTEVLLPPEQLQMLRDQVADEIAVIENDNTALRKRVEGLESGHEQIVEWSKAYPLDVFPEPDFEKVAKILKDNGMTLDAISASNMRHVVEGVGKIAKGALASQEEADLDKLTTQQKPTEEAMEEA